MSNKTERTEEGADICNHCKVDKSQGGYCNESGGCKDTRTIKATTESKIMELNDEDFEKLLLKEEEVIAKAVEFARKNGMNLTKFKKEISKVLPEENDEDQWTFDYESYLLDISVFGYKAPSKWGLNFYFNRGSF